MPYRFSGNDVATLISTSVTNNSTVAGTPPTFSSAATNTAGTKVILTYNEALSATTAAISAFAVTTAVPAIALLTQCFWFYRTYSHNNS